MGKSIVGVVIGAIVYFIWGAVSWTVLPWHDSTIKAIPEEQLISDTLKTVVSEPGFYFFPSDKLPDGTRTDETIWVEKYKKGPIGVVIFNPNGQAPMNASIFLYSFIQNIICAAILMFLLKMAGSCASGFLSSGLFGATVGLLAGLATHGMQWNWFHFPTGYTLINIADVMIAFALTGMAVTKFVPKGDHS